jgi:hypothetical protein
MSELPFKLDPDFDYILDEADRKKFAPVQQGDEFWHHTLRRWEASGRVDEPCFTPSYHYRRRKSSGWVSVKERLPESGQPVLAIPASNDDTRCGFPVGLEIYNETGYRWVKKITHWMPLPALPQPPRPAAEVAFEEWASKGHSTIVPRNTWLAAIDWAKSHKGEL